MAGIVERAESAFVAIDPVKRGVHHPGDEMSLVRPQSSPPPYKREFVGVFDQLTLEWAIYRRHKGARLDAKG